MEKYHAFCSLFIENQCQQKGKNIFGLFEKMRVLLLWIRPIGQPRILL